MGFPGMQPTRLRLSRANIFSTQGSSRERNISARAGLHVLHLHKILHHLHQWWHEYECSKIGDIKVMKTVHNVGLEQRRKTSAQKLDFLSWIRMTHVALLSWGSSPCPTCSQICCPAAAAAATRFKNDVSQRLLMLLRCSQNQSIRCKSTCGP